MGQQNKLRIIAGKWRGRKIAFPDAPGLRPTPDRVRETVFNWLMQSIVDASALDLFTGSGALGFEALSRGAAQVTFVDQDASVTRALLENATILDANAAVLQQDATDLSALRSQTFNLVFLDPPFNQGLVATALQALLEAGCLAPDALVYVEMESTLEIDNVIDDTWTIVKAKTAGQVGYYLLRYS